MRTAILAILCLAAPAAFSQESPAQPDYSREQLRHIFTSDPAPPGPQSNFHVGVGYVEFRALGAQWRLGFLPILAPLAGSVPTTRGLGMPDAFGLNHVVIPGGPLLPEERDADEQRELRRIARITARP